MLKSLATAITTLTIIPAPVREGSKLVDALWWFPAVGCMLGLVLWVFGGLLMLISGGAWPGGAAIAIVAGGVILTRGLHIDGLADWADGFGAIRDRERTLAIMKDHSTGVFGVTAVVIVLLAKFSALARIASADLLPCIVGVMTVSRTMQVELAATMPYARAEGGMAGPFVRDAQGYHRIGAALFGLVLVVAACGPVLGATMFAAAWFIGKCLGVWAMKRIGGVTGDVLGASSEIIEMLLFCDIALLAQWAGRYLGWGWMPVF